MSVTPIPTELKELRIEYTLDGIYNYAILELT